MTPHKQFHQICAKQSGVIFMFRQGDKYIACGEHARTVHRVLGVEITSTVHGDTVMMTMPAIEDYVCRLIVAGYKVVIDRVDAELDTEISFE